MFTRREIIDLAIQIEKNGEAIYQNALQFVSNPSVHKLLQKLADEEVQHAKWFSELKEKILEATNDPQLEEISKSILSGILGNQVFSLKDADISKIKHMKDLLDLAIEFERDTILFYEMLRSLIEDGGTLSDLDKIIEEENKHVQLFQEILVTGNFEIKND